MALCISLSDVHAQPDPNNGNGGSTVGGGAPIGSGLISMVFLGLSYAIVKSRKAKKRNPQ